MGESYGDVEVSSVAQWRDWLAEHHGQLRGIWVVTWKKHVPDRHVSYDDLVRQALCFGWIDGTAGKVDDQRSRLLMARRSPRSAWSRLNKTRVAELTEAGLMQPAGLAAVAAAQQSGQWTALDAVEELVEPAELAAALDADPAARRHWDAFPRSAKRAILEWIRQARRPETRARRIAEAAGEAAQNRRANQWPRRP